MVLVKEYRIPLPLKVDEFRKGQLYAVAECSKNETGGGEGVEFAKNEEFTSTTLIPGKTMKGMYTYKIYRLRSKAPWILQKALPPEAFEVHEESWNAYPYSKTVITNPSYMKKDFHLTIETIHLQDNGETENPLGAGKREIVDLDIADDSLLCKKDIKPETDPKVFKSTKVERGPLRADWIEKPQPNTPMMCAYKLVTLHFKWTGFTSLFEKTIHKQYPRVFMKFHREAYCWFDRWIDFTDDDLRKMEAETALQLKKLISDEEKRGATCNDGNEKKSVMQRVNA